MTKAHTGVNRRAFVAGSAAVGGAVLTGVRTRRATAQAKPTITYWNGLTGADGKVMDELIDQFTRETGIAGRAAAHPVGRPLRQAPGLRPGRTRGRTSR